MAVLYRKYRPQTFSEVLSQKPIIQTLKNQVASGSVAHAYLFTGSRGVGKTSVARILAKAVNCQNPKDGEACGKCDVCVAISQNNFLDLVEIDAASNTGVDNIRELIEHVKFSPSSGKYKVFIIDEVHMLSKGAFNALLKTLEEPPAHAIFILATTEINKVPATIVSRTQRFDFKALSEADIFEHLKNIAAQEKISIDDGILELVAQNAEGSVRDALSLLDKLLTLGNTITLEESRQLLGITDIKTCENLLELLSAGKAEEIPGFLNGLSSSGLDYAVFSRDFLEFLRKVLICKISPQTLGANLSKDHQDKIKELAQKFSVADLIFIIRLFLKAYKDLPFSPSPQVPVLLAGIEAALRKSQVIGDKPQASYQKADIPRTDDIKKNNPEPPKPPLIAVETVEVGEPVMLFSELQIFWPKILEKIKGINGPLASMLRAAHILEIRGNSLVLGVKFLFDKKSLENPKNSDLIMATLLEITGQRMGITAQVIKAESQITVESAEVLSEALKVFGGELID